MKTLIEKTGKWVLCGLMAAALTLVMSETTGAINIMDEPPTGGTIHKPPPPPPVLFQR